MSKTDSVADLQFVDEKERELFARARLGESVKDFLRSDVGRYLHGRARLQLEAAKEEMLDISTDSWLGRRKIKRIQARAAVARAVMGYCVDAIQDGEVAYQELDEREGRDS